MANDTNAGFFEGFAGAVTKGLDEKHAQALELQGQQKKAQFQTLWNGMQANAFRIQELKKKAAGGQLTEEEAKELEDTKNQFDWSDGELSRMTKSHKPLAEAYQKVSGFVNKLLTSKKNQFEGPPQQGASAQQPTVDQTQPQPSGVAPPQPDGAVGPRAPLTGPPPIQTAQAKPTKLTGPRGSMQAAMAAGSPQAAEERKSKAHIAQFQAETVFDSNEKIRIANAELRAKGEEADALAKKQDDAARAFADTLTPEKKAAFLEAMAAKKFTGTATIGHAPKETKNIPGTALVGKKDAYGNATDPKITYTEGEDGKLRPEAAPPKAEAAVTGEFEKFFLPNFAKGLGKTVDQLTPAENTKAFREFKQDPATTASLAASRNIQDAMHQMQLAQQPTPDQAKQVAGDVVAHRLAPDQLASMFGGFGATGQSFKRMVYLEAKKLDPEFDFEQAAAEYGLVKSPTFQNTIRYMDSVTESIPLVIQRANELKNSNVRFANGLRNFFGKELSDPTLKQFKTTALLVADEIAKILQGGSGAAGTSDAKLRQAAEIIDSADSPQAIAAALGEVKELIGFRRKALTRGTYMARQEPGGGEKKKEASPNGTLNGPNGIPTITTKAQRDALPAGSQYVKDGVTYTKQ